jgi:hypothetical protein
LGRDVVHARAERPHLLARLVVGRPEGDPVILGRITGSAADDFVKLLGLLRKIDQIRSRKL